MEQFECKTKIVSGPGAVGALASLGAKRLFLVTDPYFAKNGTAGRIAQTAGAAETEIFDQAPCGRAPAIAGERVLCAQLSPLRRLRRHLSQRARLFVSSIITQIGRENKFSANLCAYQFSVKNNRERRIFSFYFSISAVLFIASRNFAITSSLNLGVLS